LPNIAEHQVETKGVFMKFQVNENKWRIGGMLAIAGMILFGTPALAGDASVKYPAKRIVTGHVMKIVPPFEKGRDGEIMVNEQIYRISTKTLLVDRNEKKTELDHFKVGNFVYMVVDLYADRREALFISPAEDPDNAGAKHDQNRNR
jgi:hypothetical protein